MKTVVFAFARFVPVEPTRRDIFGAQMVGERSQRPGARLIGCNQQATANREIDGNAACLFQASARSSARAPRPRGSEARQHPHACRGLRRRPPACRRLPICCASSGNAAFDHFDNGKPCFMPGNRPIARLAMPPPTIRMFMASPVVPDATEPRQRVCQPWRNRRDPKDRATPQRSRVTNNANI